MADLVFEAVQEADGGYCAECLTENIFTEGDTWDELRGNVIDATAAFFFEQPPGSNPPPPGRGRGSVDRLKLPRDVSGDSLAATLCRRWRYRRVHQSGSHIIPETEEPSRRRIAAPITTRFEWAR